MDVLKQIQQRAVKMIKGLEHPSYKKRQKKLELFSLHVRKLRGSLLIHRNI